MTLAGGLLMGTSVWVERHHHKESGLRPTFSVSWWRDALHRHDLLHGLELTLFDWRVRRAADSAQGLSPQLSLVVAEERTVKSLRLRYPLGESFGLLFPRQLYGRVLRELTAQGAKAVAFDVLLPDDRPDHPSVVLPGSTNSVTSDGFFASQIAAHGRVVLASLADLPPAPRFRNVAHALGEVDSPRDIDGSARRVRAFTDCRFFGGQLIAYASKRGLLVEAGPTNTIRLREPGSGRELLLPISPDKQVELELGGARLAVPAYEERRVWNLGIVLAAEELGIDLTKADIRSDRIVLRGNREVQRILPVDAER